MLKLLKSAKDRLLLALKHTDELPDDMFGKEVAPKLPNAAGLKKLRAKVKHRTASGKIKVALDESVGSAMAKKIEGKGYAVVCRAGNAEPDNVWMKRAFDAGALFVVSPDFDIPSLIEKQNYPMIWIDFLFAGEINTNITSDSLSRDAKRNIWVQYVHDRIQAKLKFLNNTFGE